ncbi:MAG: TolB family protein [Acidobacteriota bacterium]
MRGEGWTRRNFLSSMAVAAAAERFRYDDPSTELSILRLTSPEHSSWLPAPENRAISRRRAFLVFSSDRSGSPQAYQMFLSSGEFRQLSRARDLDSSSVTLAADDRSVFYMDGPALVQLSLQSLKEREVYRVREGWSRAPGFSVSPDGSTAALVETNSAVWQIRTVPLGGKAAGAATTAGEFRTAVTHPMLRPGRGEVLYREAGGGLGLAGRELPLAERPGGPVYWSPDGANVMYLGGSAIREYTLETGAERLVAKTSQFASFSPNGDGSVFVGASASKASPYVLLLLRVTRREMALCEHRASDAARVAPVFSPDSQRVYFVSDRHGKPAIYTVSVERLVAKTGG